jgi:predicted GNAT family acetyltransferase
MAAHVKHNSQDQEFTIQQDGFSGELAYSKPQSSVIDFTHTFVAEELRGKGLAEELAKAGLAYARQEGLKVQTSCQFMASYVQQHPEYQDILA